MKFRFLVIILIFHVRMKAYQLEQKLKIIVSVTVAILTFLDNIA